MLRPERATRAVAPVPARLAKPAPAPSPAVASVSAAAQAAAASDDRRRVLMAQGLEAAQAGDLREAARLFTRAVDLDPADADAWNSLGVVLIRQEEVTRGMEALRRALRVRSGHLEAHVNLAVALDRQGRSREAVRHYRAFLDRSPEADPRRDRVSRRIAELTPVARSIE
ncbi:MAG TPA: tetratricopeptide repeat protein [Methylomirabilota bacterium]|nr:tetratricopeptide repeat protein [Methylomirabilota bacterium]